MQVYRPSNRVPVSGIVLLLIYTALGGFITGALVYAIAHWFYLIILFPIVMGFMGGVSVSAAIKRGQVRNPLMGIVFGMLVGVVIYGSYMLLDYREFRGEARAIISDEAGADAPIDNAMLESFVDMILVEETGSTGFVGFLKLQANEGISIGRVGRGNGINLGASLSWAYWAIETIMIMGIAAAIARSAAKQPFCESHNRWYGKKQRVGGVSDTQSAELVQLLRSGSYVQAAQLLEAETQVPSAEVHLEQCDGCHISGPQLTVQRVSLNAKGKTETKELLQGLLAPHEAIEFMRHIATQPAQAGLGDPTPALS